MILGVVVAILIVAVAAAPVTAIIDQFVFSSYRLNWERIDQAKHDSNAFFSTFQILHAEVNHNPPSPPPQKRRPAPSWSCCGSLIWIKVYDPAFMLSCNDYVA